mmetsp:Transcript_42729/g.91665  ORF Transcript_42729/g.91665 Transcript_42729/m.91665 type:complete len:117 (-) Transcript_42729:773-1123(-)
MQPGTSPGTASFVSADVKSDSFLWNVPSLRVLVAAHTACSGYETVNSFFFKVFELVVVTAQVVAPMSLQQGAQPLNQFWCWPVISHTVYRMVPSYKKEVGSASANLCFQPLPFRLT